MQEAESLQANMNQSGKLHASWSGPGMRKAENTSNCMPLGVDRACGKRKTRQTACLLKGIGHADRGKSIKKHASWSGAGMRKAENT